jgi:hypothetical protein
LKYLRKQQQQCVTDELNRASRHTIVFKIHVGASHHYTRAFFSLLMASKPLLPTNQTTATGTLPSDQKNRGAIRRTTKAAHKLKVLPEQPEPATPSRVIPEEEEEDGDDEEEEATASASDAAEDDEEVEVSTGLLCHRTQD